MRLLSCISASIAGRRRRALISINRATVAPRMPAWDCRRMMRTMPRRPGPGHPLINRFVMAAQVMAILTAGAAYAAAFARSDEPAAAAVGKTGKERLGEKASDEQRVDDCKVPPAQRTRSRPTACPWDVTK